MEVTNKIPVFADDLALSTSEWIEVSSHWSLTDRIQLAICCGSERRKVMVPADDLKRAIQNATNHKA